MVGDRCKRAIKTMAKNILRADFSQNTLLSQRALELVNRYNIAYMKTDTYHSNHNVNMTINYRNLKNTVMEVRKNSYSAMTRTLTNDPLNGIRGFICLLLLSYRSEDQFMTDLFHAGGSNYFRPTDNKKYDPSDYRYRIH